jgi:small-conductance mechanosensitive channel
VNSTIINHARGGGDGEGRRISLVQDIGVSYDEDIDHVKYTILKLIRECPYVLETPEPRVLLIELGDFAKVFRMYCWVGDYSDEYVTRDWVLKNLDEQFKDEGIEIPYPTVVEINEESESYSDQRGKKASVRVARLQMIKEDKKLLEERAAAKIEVDIITQKLKDPDLDRKEKQMLEDDLNELNKVLGMFEAGGDD